MQRIRRFVQFLGRSVREHPVVVGIVAVGAVVALVFGYLVGIPPVPYLAMIVATLGLGLWASAWLRRRADDGAGVPGAAVFAGYLAAAVIVTLLAQLVPFGWDHSNPPVTGEPSWASPRTRQLMVNACFACHSNEVDYPWYSNVAPVSWAVSEHVEEGRESVNYSQFPDNPGGGIEDSVEVVAQGSMPPPYFTRFGMHPEANLTEKERAELIVGLRMTPGLSERGGGRGERE